MWVAEISSPLPIDSYTSGRVFLQNSPLPEPKPSLLQTPSIHKQFTLHSKSGASAQPSGPKTFVAFSPFFPSHPDRSLHQNSRLFRDPRQLHRFERQHHSPGNSRPFARLQAQASPKRRPSLPLQLHQRPDFEQRNGLHSRR